MTDGSRRCTACGGTVPAGAPRCPVCDAPIGAPARAAPGPTPPHAPAAPVHPRSEEVEARLGRLKQWAVAARSLGLDLPGLPAWAERYVRSGEEVEGWLDVLRGIERIAQQRIVAALEAWRSRTQGRLRRLEAYSVDSRLEREEIADAVHAAKGGEVARALAIYQRVDRVVALKERHLDQAREDLERLLSLLRDMQALALPAPDDPDQLGPELERELERGKLAAFKQRLRELHTAAVAELEREIPGLVRSLGDQLLKSRRDGLKVDADAEQLARAARALARGRPEDALRSLRRVSSMASGPRPPGD